MLQEKEKQNNGRKLYSEILDASQNKGSAKREDTHKMAESNKACTL